MSNLVKLGKWSCRVLLLMGGVLLLPLTVQYFVFILLRQKSANLYKDSV